MITRRELSCLAAARPDILDDTEFVVDAAQEDQILHHILESAVPSGAGIAEGPVTEPTTTPPRRRPGRLGIAAAAAAATAIISVGAVAGSGAFRGVPGGGTPVRPKAQAIGTEVLARRAKAAASDASEADVVYSQTVYSGGSAGGDASIEEWDFGLSTREKLFNAQGALTEDTSAVVAGGLRERRFVDYTSRTWQQDSIPVAQYGPGPSIADDVSMFLGVEPSGRPHPDITQVTVGGRPLFQVTARWQLREIPAGDPGGMNPLPAFASSQLLPEVTYSGEVIETGWLDAATYLPVRVVLTQPDGQVLASETLQWLAPDAATQAELTPAPVPPGFSETVGVGH